MARRAERAAGKCIEVIVVVVLVLLGVCWM
jgi:hypothetical protein